MLTVWKAPGVGVVLLAAWMVALPARAGRFETYSPQGSFDLPGGASVFNVLTDGRVIALSGADIYVESAPGSRSFNVQGALAGMDVPGFGSSFLSVSPDGSKFAVGNGGGATFGNFQVGVFDTATLTGDWFSASHFDAAWLDGSRLAVTAGSFGSPARVTLLDTTSADPANPINPSIIDNIGGSSAGITFDAAGNLYTGNGFDLDGAVGSNTGDLKIFDAATLASAIGGGGVLDFETQGAFLGRLLSASSLGFDDEGNLFVGGGDLFGSGDGDYAGLVRSGAVAGVLSGGGPVDVLDPNQVRRFDPDGVSAQNFYDLAFNPTLGELYVRQGQTVYVLPEPSMVVLLCAGGLILRRPRRS
ncbi:MAG: hypothetical protein ACE5GE_15575 [Phycisphaerae bacterium]